MQESAARQQHIRAPATPMRRLESSSRGELAETLQPIAPGVQFHPTSREKFHARLQLARLPRMSLFRFLLPDTRVIQRGPRRFLGLTIPEVGGFRIRTPKADTGFAGDSAHVLSAAGDFDLRTSGDCVVFVVHFNQPLLDEHASKLHNRELRGLGKSNPKLSLHDKRTAGFMNWLRFTWNQLRLDAPFLRSPIALGGVEENLLSQFLCCLDGLPDGDVRRDDPDRDPVCLRRAEEYIEANLLEPVMVADIAAAAGVSVPTLNRAFRSKRGLGPKAFLKRRRLELLRRDLLASDPGQNTVTQLAARYGFFHMGQLAIDYKRAFHESPSKTLRQ